MPGGADLPYCRALNGPGNQIIRGNNLPTPLQLFTSVKFVQCLLAGLHLHCSGPPKEQMNFAGRAAECFARSEFASDAGFVERGGSYLGLCAGAYYACSFVEFELGTRYLLSRNDCQSFGVLSRIYGPKEARNSKIEV